MNGHRRTGSRQHWNHQLAFVEGPNLLRPADLRNIRRRGEHRDQHLAADQSHFDFFAPRRAAANSLRVEPHFAAGPAKYIPQMLSRVRSILTGVRKEYTARGALA